MFPPNRKHQPGELVLGQSGRFPFAKKYLVPGKARNKHVQVIGRTGKGKSKLLEAMIVQDIAARQASVILIDPHSDLISSVVANCLSSGVLSFEDTGRVIYFDPTDPEYIIPFNVLARKARPHETAEQMVEAIRRAFPKSLEEAAVFTQIALASFDVLAENSLTFIDLPRLLMDKPWREELLKNVTNQEALFFFREVYEGWGGKDQIMLSASTVNKVMQYTFNPDLRLALGQPDNRLDFRAAMDNKMVVLVDLGKLRGISELLTGALILTSIEQEAMSRRDVPAEERTPVYCHIDESQRFISRDTETLSHILSECRKFNLGLTLAHQNMGQVEHVKQSLENVHTRVVFGVGGQDAKYFAEEMGGVDVEEIKSQPKTETQHPQFRPIFEQFYIWRQMFKGQPTRQAYVEGHDAEVAQIKTQAIADYKVSPAEVEAFLKACIQTHGISRLEAEKNLSSGQPLVAEAVSTEAEIPAYEILPE